MLVLICLGFLLLLVQMRGWIYLGLIILGILSCWMSCRCMWLFWIVVSFRNLSVMVVWNSDNGDDGSVSNIAISVTVFIWFVNAWGCSGMCVNFLTILTNSGMLTIVVLFVLWKLKIEYSVVEGVGMYLSMSSSCSIHLICVVYFLLVKIIFNCN